MTLGALGRSLFLSKRAVVTGRFEPVSGDFLISRLAAAATDWPGLHIAGGDRALRGRVCSRTSVHHGGLRQPTAHKLVHLARHNTTGAAAAINYGALTDWRN